MALVWITGATGAVGSALARRLIARGDAVVLTARNTDRLLSLASELGGPAYVVAADATQEQSIQSALTQIEQQFGTPTGLAHCVGSIFIRSLHATSQTDLHDAFTQNFFSAWNVLREFVRAASRNKLPGSAVLIGSIASTSGFANHEAIASAKAAVAALARSAAATYADRGIRVNCVHPGLTLSGMSARLTASAESVARLSKLNPLGRLGRGDDTAAAIAFLLGNDADWITGQQFGVDGGQANLQQVLRT